MQRGVHEAQIVENTQDHDQITPHLRELKIYDGIDTYAFQHIQLHAQDRKETGQHSRSNQV